MVLFSTILPVKEDVSTISIFELILNWSNKKHLAEETLNIGNTYIWRYTSQKGIPWTETFVYIEDKHLLYIMQETDYVTADIRNLEARYVTPSLITWLIKDDMLSGVSLSPVTEVFDIDLPKLIINRYRNDKMVETLAYRLKGAAEVVCPARAGKDNQLLFRGQKTALPCMVGISEKEVYNSYVHTALSIGRRYLYDPKYSWEVLSNKRQQNFELEKLNKQLSEEKEMVAAYEEEVTMLENKLIAAQNQLSANSVYIDGLENKLHNSEKIPLIYYGSENDIYNGEIKDIILSILEREYKNIPEKTRRRDVLGSILSANDVSGVGSNILSQVKKALKDYKSLSGSCKLLLESLGFEVENTKEHYKIRFKGDNRYLVVLSKTASDYKQGKNFTSDMSIEMF